MPALGVRDGRGDQGLERPQDERVDDVNLGGPRSTDLRNGYR